MFVAYHYHCTVDYGISIRFLSLPDYPCRLRPARRFVRCDHQAEYTYIVRARRLSLKLVYTTEITLHSRQTTSLCFISSDIRRQIQSVYCILISGSAVPKHSVNTSTSTDPYRLHADIIMLFLKFSFRPISFRKLNRFEV